ncbi:MAG: sigma-70 family RNA polymerase sigma factor [Sedimentisphaerales bacterium]|nr:sigma-70 family RNA polymerase sigma factor [Sedimentisphaerales bacterium]
MSGISKAEEVLLEQIRSGDQHAWEQLVTRYRGRLLSFARAKLGQRADAEDIIQDTFIAFLTGLSSFRADAGIETYLFTILRRKIINSYRSAHSKHICLLQDVYQRTQRTIGDSDAFSAMPSDEMTASFYARKDEQNELLRSTLSEALTVLVDNYKSTLNFRDMQIVELLFYCQFSNKDVARIVEINERNIAVIKHRCLKQVRDHAASSKLNVTQETQLEDLLTQVWEAGRLSCPKRSTIGAYMLGTLDGNWHDYVKFHLNKLGCHFCRANLTDLQEQTAEDKSQHLQKRIMESTIGFLHKPR